jgi:hypothetical protein
MLIWARMMLVNDEDRDILQKSDVLRGILASLYCFQADPSLIAAFLTYWNLDGHTLVTSQGEMGYPLHTIPDAMGIPISGRLYEEFIPLPSDVHGDLETLYAIYIGLCPTELQPRPGLVNLSDWMGHFFGEDANSFGTSLFDGFADPKDPLRQRLRFRVELRADRPTAVLGAETLSYRVTYSSKLYRAAFIAAWLCTYCIPVDAGQYIRPEVFIMALKIAEGGRRAIGVASLAFLYRCLDNAHENIISGTRSASECSLFIPGHFVVGWFASFWKRARISEPFHRPIKFPPFVINLARINPVDIEEAHHIFWDFDGDGRGLRSLDFLGRSSLRFPEGRRAILVRDGRTKHAQPSFAISISAIELLMSCSIGGVTYRRGEHFDNLVYCPHRFTRMFNCDQAIPYFDYRAEDNLTDCLNFRSYMPTSRKVSFQICVRRHLSYYQRPAGHTLLVQPLMNGTSCSLNYMNWCFKAFKFLQDPTVFCNRIHMPGSIRSTPAAHAGNTLR